VISSPPLDDSCFGVPQNEGKRGCGTEKTKALAAVSLNEKGNPQYTKMAVAGSLTGDGMAGFAEKNIVEGSVISGDAYSSYATAFSSGTYTHEPVKFDRT
jgi:hypothetical protein